MRAYGAGSGSSWNARALVVPQASTLAQGAGAESVRGLMNFRTSRGAYAWVLGLVLVACSDSEGSNRNNNGGEQSGNAGTGGNGTSGTSTGGNGTGGNGAPSAAAIQMRFAAPAAPAGGTNDLLAFSGGGARRPGLESLKYSIQSVSICESLETTGTAFNNPNGCLELYRGELGALSPYGLEDDWTPLAAAARTSDVGFVDLLDPTARETLAANTELRAEHVRQYNYGVITWSLPIKVKASFVLNDGSRLYTHDGTTIFETIGVDSYRDYFTTSATPLDVAPAEEAVVLLGNGGNWFKFQNPLSITEQDISEKRQWVLDLVFNPEGIVKGFAGEGATRGNLRERDSQGTTLRAVTVPLLDLAPVPHRASEAVVRESYRASVLAGSDAFDVRLELYSVEGDPNNTVYGVDAKTLVTPATTSVPPEFSKISFIELESDGSLSFQSFSHTAILTGFRRVTGESGSTTAHVACSQYGNQAGAEGGSAIVVNQCPASMMDVSFELIGRTTLEGQIPEPTLPDADAGVPGDAGPSGADAGAGDASP
jgi:hypothetical protein